MATFDLDAFRDAHRPWEFKAGGFVFRARILSAEQLRRFWAAYDGAAPQAQAEAVQRLLRAAFPWRLSYRWRGDPVAKLLALEPVAQQEALNSFFAWVRQTQGIALPPTAGTPSPTPTPAPTP